MRGVSALCVLLTLSGCGGTSRSALPPWPSVPQPAFGAVATLYGIPSVVTAKELRVRVWVKSKGNPSVSPYMGSGGKSVLDGKKPAQGQEFLVVVFPSATGAYNFEAKDFGLQWSGSKSELQPILCTTGYGAAPQLYDYNTTEDGFFEFPTLPLTFDPALAPVFSPNGKRNLPATWRIAIAFDVPAGGGTGKLRVGNVLNPIRW